MKSFEINQTSQSKSMDALRSETPSIVLYRMTMCPHCIAMKPQWQAATAELAREPGIHVMEVEYSNIALLPEKLRNVRFFPTIQVIRNGSVKDAYSGDRSKESIVKFALAHAKKAPAKKPSATTPPKKTVRKPRAKKV